MRELLMGNEAIALGALAAGVQVVAGYPGTPSSEVLETIAKRNPGGIHVEWSVNEKAGAEVAAGAAYCGARAMVTMKQMGLNVASDPVMCVNYIGVKGGLVIYVADDPGPISSQTEQDTRHFGKYARIPVFDCDSPEQAFRAVQEAFDFSEKNQAPVILRSTTRVCHACADIDVPEITPPAPASGFVKDSKWVIFPKLAFQNKQKLVRREPVFSDYFSEHGGNSIEGSGSIGIACGGISYAYVKEAIAGREEDFRVLKVATPYPFPQRLAESFLEQVSQVLVFEELDPFIEDALIYIKGCARGRLAQTPALPILGKRTDTVPAAGELSAEIVGEIVGEIIADNAGLPTELCSAGSDPTTPGSTELRSIGPGSAELSSTEPSSTGACPVGPCSSHASLPSGDAPDLPVRPPVLCAGCPHRGAFYAVKQAAEKAIRKGKADGDAPAYTQAVYHGDIGCYTLGNAAPLNMVDTCLCMGAGITMAQGMHHADPGTLNFAFAGDSTFFASGITGVVNAVYNQADMILCILDNSTTAMTGHQPHPGMGITVMGQKTEPIRIEKVLEGIGVPWIRIVDPLDHKASVDAVSEAIHRKGVRAILFRSPCIALIKKTNLCKVDAQRCTGCMRCIRQIGCPAISPGREDGKALIDPALCNGCGLCGQICPAGCIEEFAMEDEKEERS